MNAEPTFTMEMNGQMAVPCGISIVDRDMMLRNEYLDEAYMLTDLEDFVVNINTVADLRLAEKVLKKRKKD